MPGRATFEFYGYSIFEDIHTKDRKCYVNETSVIWNKFQSESQHKKGHKILWIAFVDLNSISVKGITK